MQFLENPELMHDILSKANVGLWVIEMGHNFEPRMYADETMARLLGLNGDESPEYTYATWYNRIHPAHYDAVNSAVDKMMAGEHAEVQYPWFHPDRGEIYIRCGGTRNLDYPDIHRLEGCHQDVTELIHVQKQVNEMQQLLEEAETEAQKAMDYASTDAMTRVYNRSGFVEKAKKIIDINNKNGVMSYVMYLDLDNLKEINDRFGHSAGDYALVSFAKTLKDIVGYRGVVGRIGGDEFAIVASYREPDDDGAFFDTKIPQMLEEFNRHSGKPFNLTASMGGKMIHPGDSLTLEKALKSADKLLYEAKDDKPLSVVKE